MTAEAVLSKQEKNGSSSQGKELAFDRKGTHHPPSWEVSQTAGVQVQVGCYDSLVRRWTNSCRLFLIKNKARSTENKGKEQIYKRVKKEAMKHYFRKANILRKYYMTTGQG